MSRKRSSNSSNDGCIVALLPLILALGLVAGVLKLLIDNIGIVLIVVAVVGAVAGIIVAINKGSKKREQVEAEKQRNLSIVNAVETTPVLASIPSSTVFSSKEEEYVNTSFREFLKNNNDVVVAQSHIDYLGSKANALRSLGRMDEASQLDSEIKQAQLGLSQVLAKRGGTFESRFSNFLYKSAEVKTAFTAFASKLPNERLPLIGEYFQSPQIKIVSLGDSSALLFAPAYLMNYSGSGQTIKLIQYKDVSVSSWVTTEILDGQRQPNDEIEHIGYRYETKDGNRDMRYSWDNNPAYTYVYRGTATIRCGGSSYRQSFSNKSLTEEFEKAVKAYISLLCGKYKNVVSDILTHNDELTSAGTIDTYLAQQAAAERLKEAAEKAEREKQEKVKREREAREKAKREKEQAEREAEARERQRKADFLKSLTIVDRTLTNWYGNDRRFVMPEGLVTTIGTAFRWKNNLETVELPNGVSSILANAFHGSTSLKRVVIPKSVNEIGKEAFLGCVSLSEISLPRGIKTIAPYMFGKCSSLRSIVIPVGVTKIEHGAFSGCSSLKEINLPEGLTVVEDDAFENCSSLEKVSFPSSAITIGKNVFNGCIALEHVVLGGGIKRIPDACFNNQQKLKEVTVAPDLVEIGDRAFKNCQRLVKIHFTDPVSAAASKGMDFEAVVSGKPLAREERIGVDSLEKIGKSAFEGCFSFEGLELFDGLRIIGEYAFANCRSINSVNIPKTVTSFGIGAFLGCTALTSVKGFEYVDWHKKCCFTGTPWLSTQAEDGFVISDGYLEAYTGSDTAVTLPQGVKTIGRSSFDGNAYVSSVIIPEGVTSIEELAFANCKMLKSVRIADSVMRIEDNAFANDLGLIIQCSRGSVASSFRIRNKISGEYIAKSKAVEPTDKPQVRKSRGSIGDGLAELSEDELRVVMEMRRKKMAKKAEKAKPVKQEKTDYTLVPFDGTKVSIRLLDETRKITNNIFVLRFSQDEPVGNAKATAEYETFVIDSNGQIISTIKTLSADKTGDDLTHKVTYSLSAQEKFDKTSAYYVVLRYKGAGTNILSKTQYQISIEFASDFDF